MKNRLKHALSLLLCLVMLAALMPSGTAQASQTTAPAGTAYYINPFYKDLYTPEQVRSEAAKAARTREVKSSAPSYSTVNGAVSYFRQELAKRTETISFAIPTSLDNQMSDPFHQLYDAAVAHSESCTGQEGDALLWGIGYWNGSCSYSGGSTVYTYTPHYYSTAAQEKTLTGEVNSAMSSLALSGKTERQKILAIHDFICDRVNYDYEHVSDTSYELQYTAYAAMHNRTAVCQGYAILFYRMCKEAGLDVRVITSVDHAWNIVRIGSLYYNVDTTWDGGDDETIYDWFLKGMRDFPDHPREYPYNTDAFAEAYPMAPDAALNLENLDVTFTTPGGAKVSSAANGRPKILIFGNIFENHATRNVLMDFGNYSFTGLDVYCVDISKNGRDAVRAEAASLGCSSMTCCWDVEDGNVWAMWDYLERCGYGDDSVYLPVIVYVDANNRIQTYSTDEVTAVGMADNVRDYFGMTLRYRAPRLTVKPSDTACCDGDRVELEVTALGKGELSYQWYLRSGPGASWQKSGSATARSALYVTTAAERMNGWQFRCAVSNAYGTVYTDPVTLTVYGAPVITTQPHDIAAPIGDTALFKVQAVGAGLRYQWQYKVPGGTNWLKSPMGGAATATLRIPVTAARNGQQFRCLITDSRGRQVITDTVRLSVKTVITTQPHDITAPIGETALFKVQATGAGLRYQWQYKAAGGTNWLSCPFNGAQTAALAVPTAAYRNGYQYRCLITDANGKKTYTVNVRLCVKTVITTQPHDVTASVGETALFKVQATGVGLTYQWQYKAAGGTNWLSCPFDGAETAALAVPAVAYRNGYQYRCLITDTNGVKTCSDAARLTVV